MNAKAPFVSLLILIPLLVTKVAQSQEFVEGQHYSIIDDELTTNTQEVVEYFSFSCPGCYAIEPHIQKLQQQLPSKTVRRVHVPFGGRNAKLSQKAYVLMKMLNADENLTQIFSRIHRQKKTFNNENDLVAFFVSLGHNEVQIKTILSSFSADMMLRKMNAEAAAKGISSVPSIIINGRYQVNTNAVQSGISLARLTSFLDQAQDE